MIYYLPASDLEGVEKIGFVNRVESKASPFFSFSVQLVKSE